ncbi:MAG: phospho-sugar mutase [Lachnospiraceae bacterium]|nr:phospho-sugar mutase [Lachnospiraceae bacterium]
MDYREKYEYWITADCFDENTKNELKAITDDKEIQERFYKDLEFGTGGLRGVIGAGSNRMNIYTVRKATQGLANYIIKNNGQDRGVAIAFDSRIMSPEFSLEAALCLNANGIKTYRYDTLHPTPMLSFAVRQLKCIAGIVVTASHNPREYNGYKVYWEDGAQVTPPHDIGIIDEVNAITDYAEPKTMSLEDAKAAGLFNVLGKEMDDEYISTIKTYIIHPEIIEKESKDIKIVYTPLHGTGNLFVRRVLKELGFENVYVVKEQELPDGNFPTVPYPNPEDPKAFKLALELAEKVDADIVMATDPDADRLGIFVKDAADGEYKIFNGNMLGTLIGEYILRERELNGTLPENAAYVTTIVSTNLSQAIAKAHNTKCFETLTGFKWICGQVKQFEDAGNSYKYVFGFEESYGCLIGDYVRDKDAVSAVMMLAEIASYCKANGETLLDELEKMYKKYGYYAERLRAVVMPGMDGAEKIKALMEKLRSDPPTVIGGYKVKEFRDYRSQICIDPETKEEHPTGIPSSNVLYFDLEGDCWCCMRPSGTEPKIKFYMGAKDETMDAAKKRTEDIETALTEIVEG